MFRDRALVFLALGQTLAWAGLYYIFPALLLRWERELGWSKAELTAAITLAVLISAICSPLAGRLIDRGHGPAMMAFASVCGGAGLLLLSMVSALWQFYAVWALIGVTMAGCLYEPCFAIVTRARGPDAKRGIIFITLFGGFASSISFPVAHALSESLGWRTAVTLCAAVVALVVAPLLLAGGRALGKTSSEQLAPRSVPLTRRESVVHNPAFWLLAFGLACIALVHGATLHHLLSILDEFGLSGETAVLAASFIGPMQIAGRLAMMASERFASHTGITVAAFLLIGVSVVLLMFSGVSPVFLTAFVILFGGAYGTVSILRPVNAREILGEKNFGAKSGALALLYLVGSAAAPYLGSLVWGWGGYRVLLPALAGLSLLGCALYIAAHRRSQPLP